MNRRELDVLAVPLAGGQLIEASAGTGKTYAITNLFARLVVEAGLPVERILVLTFTRAATAELRERIEQRLRSVARVLNGDASTGRDEYVSKLIERVSDRGEMRRRIELAIAGFDAAAVYTIHGFCQRVLNDNALLSSAVIDAEMLDQDGELRLQIAGDFWRRELHTASRFFAEHLLVNEGNSPGVLLDRFKRFLGKPYLRLIGGDTDIECRTIEKAYVSAYSAVSQCWNTSRDEVCDILLNSAALNRSSYKLAVVREWIASLDRLLHQDAIPTSWLPDWLVKMTPQWMADKIKRNQICPEHTFFERCEVLLRRHADMQRCHRQLQLNFRRRFIEYCNEEMPRRQRLAGVQSFDDVLNNLAVALGGHNAAQLVARLRLRYGAALIDEFQDTDPVQYEILHRIYADTDLPVYLVGDPKQAIYGFRGADVFAYIAARAGLATDPQTLGVNWRSTPRLIAAVNKIFSLSSRPFLIDEIEFQPATAAVRPRTEWRFDDDGAAFVFWTLPRPSAQEPLNKGDAAALAVRATAVEIARMLSASAAGRAGMIADDGGLRAFRGSDCAVLVRTHTQGQLVRRALAAVGIDSVELADSSVFESAEAVALTHVLRAIETPADETLVRTALVSQIFGMSGDALLELTQDETQWEQMLLRFGDYQQLWHSNGFFIMFQRLLDTEAVGQRQLAHVDGARRMTNLLQLAELLHSESVRGQRGPSQLIEWLVNKRLHENGREETEQLRLESDAALVQILTVHRSKGLEFPIVFCPFLWDSGGADRDADAPVFYHADEQNYAPTLDLSGDDRQARARADVESRAEALRVLYVALTRARHRVYAVWGSARGAEFAAPAWLLHRHRRANDEDPGVVSWLVGATEAEVRADLLALGDDGIAVRSLPVDADTRIGVTRGPAATLAARDFHGRIADPWRLLSYSGLVRRIAEDDPDHDESTTVTGDAGPEFSGMFAFPRGAQAGSCLHAILERVDFAATDSSAWNSVIEFTLQEHGFSQQWIGTVRQMIMDLTSTPLNAEGLTLSRAPPSSRINEMEFHFPVQRFDMRELVAVVKSCPSSNANLLQQLQVVETERMHGYMKGFIDLVAVIDGRWYIVDYKSNWLGASPDDYRTERLAEAIVDEAYGLQYLIYTLALHRYLQQRLSWYSYERHFGGVYYLFLRAMAPRNGTAGVHFDRIAFELLSAVDNYLRAGDKS